MRSCFPFEPTLTEQALIDAAQRRGLSVEASGFGRMLIIGDRVRRVRLLGAISHRTSRVAVRFAGDKHATKLWLKRRRLRDRRPPGEGFPGRAAAA